MLREAKSEFTAAIQHDPSYFEAYNALGFTEESLGDDAAALAAYMKAMQIAGTHDPVISFTRQQSTSQSIRTLDKCAKTGSTWATGPSSTLATHYTSSVKDPVVFLKYDGNHTYPDNVPPLIVKFFKQIVTNSIQ